MNTILQQRIEEAGRRYCQDKNYILPDDTKLSLEALTAIDAYIEGGKNSLQNQWISVDESLPQCPDDDAISEVSIKVIVKTNNGAIYYAFYHHYLNEWFSVETSVRIDGVTHWMAVPEKGGKE